MKAFQEFSQELWPIIGTKLENSPQPDAPITIDDYDDYTASGKIVKNVEEINDATFLVGDATEVGSEKGKNVLNPDLSEIFRIYGNDMTYGQYLEILENLKFKTLKFSDTRITFWKGGHDSTIETHHKVKYIVLKDIYDILIKKGIIHE